LNEYRFVLNLNIKARSNLNVAKLSKAKIAMKQQQTTRSLAQAWTIFYITTKLQRRDAPQSVNKFHCAVP